MPSVQAERASDAFFRTELAVADDDLDFPVFIARHEQVLSGIVQGIYQLF